MYDSSQYMYRSTYSNPEAPRSYSRDIAYSRNSLLETISQGPAAKVRYVNAPWYACNTYQAIFCVLFLILSGVLGVLIAMAAGWTPPWEASSTTVSVIEADSSSAYSSGHHGYYNVAIGTSAAEKKCVGSPANLWCGTHVQEVDAVTGVPMHWSISHEGALICAQRAAGWDVNLVLQCQTVQGASTTLGPSTTVNAADTAFQQTGAKVDGDSDFAYVTIGNTLDSKSSTKCVPEPHGVVCDNTAQQVGRTGQYDDTFNIYRDGGNVCARRTDADTEWGLNLVLKCKKSGTTPSPADDQWRMVQIGSSIAEKKSTKCVSAPEDVHCDDHAEQVGRTGKYSDKFHIYHDGDDICAKRTDEDSPWGLNLVLKCKNLANVDQYQDVTIGQSLHSNVKCVDDPGNVHCDNTAEQVGRTEDYPDKFDIYHKGDKICVKRTDHQDPWGLELILKCKSTALVQ